MNHLVLAKLHINVGEFVLNTEFGKDLDHPLGAGRHRRAVYFDGHREGGCSSV